MGVNSINLFSASIFTASAATAPIPGKNAPGFPDAGLMARNARIPCPSIRWPSFVIPKESKVFTPPETTAPPIWASNTPSGFMLRASAIWRPVSPPSTCQARQGRKTPKPWTLPAGPCPPASPEPGGILSSAQGSKLHPGKIPQFLKTPGIPVQRLLFPSLRQEPCCAVYGQLGRILRNLCRTAFKRPPGHPERRGGNANKGAIMRNTF